MDPDATADAAHAGDVAAVDRLVEGLAIQAEIAGRLVDGEDLGELGWMVHASRGARRSTE